MEATVAQASAHHDVVMAVLAKREIGRLWDDISKAPYTQLFNKSVTGPSLWELVRTLRAVDAALQLEAKKYARRDTLICVHGNRFIEWAVFKALNLQPRFAFADIEKSVPSTVRAVIAKVVAAVKKDYPESYPASLFKNLSKCRALAKTIG